MRLITFAGTTLPPRTTGLSTVAPSANRVAYGVPVSGSTNPGKVAIFATDVSEVVPA